jgi:anti-sigma-K factor RskA
VSDRDRIDELAALAAAGSATATERAELDSLAAADPEVRALVRSYGDAAALLALSLDEPRPPPAVLETTRQRVRGRTPIATPAVPAPAGVIPLAPRRGKPSAVVIAAIAIPLAAAAAFAFLWLRARGEGVELGGVVAGLERDLDEANRRERLAAGAMVAAQKKLEELQGAFDSLATPHLRLATVKSQADAPTIKILVDPEKRNWVVLAFNLPPAPSDRDYQLWFMREKDVVSAGLLLPGPGGSLFGVVPIPAEVGSPKGAAISLEPKGGSATPTEDQIKVGGPLI